MMMLRVRRHPDRKRREIAGAARNCRARATSQENASTASIMKPAAGVDRERRGAESEIVRKCSDAEAGRGASQYGRQERVPLRRRQ